MALVIKPDEKIRCPKCESTQVYAEKKDSVE